MRITIVRYYQLLLRKLNVLIVPFLITITYFPHFLILRLLVSWFFYIFFHNHSHYFDWGIMHLPYSIHFLCICIIIEKKLTPANYKNVNIFRSVDFAIWRVNIEPQNTSKNLLKLNSGRKSSRRNQ